MSGYLATYLLPFLGGPPLDLRGWLAYGVYFLVAWAVFVPSELGLVNPTLYILGWRLVEGTRRGRSELIICQDPPSREQEGDRSPNLWRRGLGSPADASPVDLGISAIGLRSPAPW